MCGIAGFCFANKVSKIQRALILIALADGNDERGGDSWGLCLIDDKCQIKTERGLGRLSKRSVIDIPDFDLGFLHTRKATVGEISTDNAHPFDIGNIIGAHNGGVINHDELAKSWGVNYTVDSQFLFHALDQKSELKEIRGYGAIEFIDKREPNRIYISNIGNGDLSAYSIGPIDNPIGTIWSSNERHIERAIIWGGIDVYETYKIDQGSVYYVKAGCPVLFIDKSRRLELASFTVNPRHRTWDPEYRTYSTENWEFSNDTSPTVKEEQDEGKEALKKKLTEYWNDDDWPQKRDERDSQLRNFFRNTSIKNGKIIPIGKK